MRANDSLTSEASTHDTRLPDQSLTLRIRTADGLCRHGFSHRRQTARACGREAFGELPRVYFALGDLVRDFERLDDLALFGFGDRTSRRCPADGSSFARRRRSVARRLFRLAPTGGRCRLHMLDFVDLFSQGARELGILPRQANQVTRDDCLELVFCEHPAIVRLHNNGPQVVGCFCMGVGTFCGLTCAVLGI